MSSQIDIQYVTQILSEVSEKLKKLIKEDEKSIESWIKIISQPKFNLINYLIYFILKPSISKEDKESIFLIFSNILIFNPLSVKQFQSHESFINLLISYITNSKKENGTLDIYAINILSYLFSIEQYKDYINN